MPTYIYETIGDSPESMQRFEIFQKMSDIPLATHPETGEPVRRVVSGGGGIKLKGLKRSTTVNKKSPAATACGCASAALRPNREIKIAGSCGHKHGHNH